MLSSSAMSFGGPLVVLGRVFMCCLRHEPSSISDRSRGAPPAVTKGNVMRENPPPARFVEGRGDSQKVPGKRKAPPRRGEAGLVRQQQECLLIRETLTNS